MDRSEVFSDEHRHRVDLIEKAGQHLLSMLGDVLDLSRIEAGAMPLSVDAVNLGQVIEEVLSFVSALARQHDIRLDTTGVDTRVHALADRVRLRQVLVNLLSNAIKYNREDGQVTVRAWRADDAVHIEVQDTGIGLTPAQQAQLFVPFNRLGMERSGIEGSGIGLVIVQRLLTLMGGAIQVHSRSGEGSTFAIRLPAARTAPPAESPSPPDMADLSDRTATILYAEDNDVNVALVEQIVALRPHWRLVSAPNGRQALALARRTRPDLLLIDMHLGDMTGLELAAELDRLPETCDIPRVALSADAMPDRIHAARQRGFSAYLTKPLDVMALLRCLDDRLSGHSSMMGLL
jgi:CheY-like chemotaxis protein